MHNSEIEKSTEASVQSMETNHKKKAEKKCFSVLKRSAIGSVDWKQSPKFIIPRVLEITVRNCVTNQLKKEEKSKKITKINSFREEIIALERKPVNEF